MALAPAIGRETGGKPPDPLDIPFGGELSLSQGARTPREAYFQFLKETGREGGTRSRREFAESKYGIRRPNLEETYLEALEFAVGGGGLAAIARKDALKQLGRQFRYWMRKRTTLPKDPSKGKIKELIQGIRKAPQSELDFVGDIGTNLDLKYFGTFTPKGKKYFPREVGEKVMKTEEIPSLAAFSLHPSLPTGEGINTVFHELAHARIAGTPGLKKLLGAQQEGVVRRFSNAITPFAEQAVKEGRKLNPLVPKRMLKASIDEAIGFQKVKTPEVLAKLEESRRVLRGQLPGEMRMFHEEGRKDVEKVLKSVVDPDVLRRLAKRDRKTLFKAVLLEESGEDIARKVGNIRYEGIMEGIPSAGIPDIYQFTALEGASKGGTFSAVSLDISDVKKALGKQEDRWRKIGQ